MRLVVALGNPGPRYARTRHNVGFRVAQRFCARHGIALSREAYHGVYGEGRLAGEGDSAELAVGVLLPKTYMNRSGSAVLAALAALEIAEPARDLVVVFDDVDLPFARLRVRARGGSGGHRGLGDIIECLGHRDFPRLRFGVGRPADPALGTVDYVLEPFSAEEERALPAHLERAAQALETILRAGPAVAMNTWNRDPESPEVPGASPSD